MRRRTIATILTVPLLLAACGGDDSTQDSSQPGADAEAGDIVGDGAAGGAESAATDGGEQAAEGSGSGDGGEGSLLDVAALDATPANRQLARTARLIIETEDVEQAAAQVSATASRLGGFVAEQDVQAAGGASDGPAFGVITLRVPATELDTAVADLGEVGVRVVSSSLATEDLTDQLTDTGAQLRNLRTLEGELLELLADVRDGDPQAGQLLAVFDRVNEVRGQIERLEASRAGLQDRVALATVTVELQPVPAGATAAELAAQDDVLAQAWSATRSAFGVLGELAVWLVVTILPVLAVVLGLPLLLLVGWRRARRDTTPGASTPGGPPPSGPSAQDQEPVGTA